MKRTTVIALIIVFITFGFFIYTRKNTQEQKPETKLYRNNNIGVVFKYPPILTVKSDNGIVNIHHEVPFEHHDFCDFKGEATTTIPTLTDFNVNIHISPKNLIETIRTESPYIPEENFINDKIVPSPGFIDEVKFGDKKGYSIFEGAEGCGHTVYYLDISSDRTLVIHNDFITIFSGSIDTENMERALQVPNVINKEENEKILKQLLDSINTQ